MSIAWQTSRLQLKILDQDRAAEVVDFIVGNEPCFKIWEPVREPDTLRLVNK
ncbi:hypothetical protein [Paenibacillus vortex]|uniref:hypothetical protein n=1 Tax=Paenibacillus vortex TaxID=71995 RepID=UPI0003184DBF|nr:hypothetical protein [Paenibacillus vortex]